MADTSVDEVRANEARVYFREGKYKEALDIFKSCANNDGPNVIFRAMMLGNAAQCCLKLNETKEAALLSLKCLQIDPFNPKVHYRMSVAYSRSNLRLAFKHICICIGLLHASAVKVDSASSKQFERLKSRMPTELPEEIQILPDNTSKIFVVGSMSELDTALRNGMQAVILKPGKYHLRDTIRTMLLGGGSINLTMMEMLGSASLKHSKLWLLGFSTGTSIVKPSNPNMGHVVSCESDASTVVVENISVVDNSMQRNGASFVVAGTNNKMAIKNCNITKSGDNPVLCANGALVHVIDSCFEGIPMASGVEIREQGRGKIVGCSMKDLRQGVIAYAGAQDVHIRDCTVESTLAEAFLFDGTKQNASTRAQQQDGMRSMDNIPFNAHARQVSEQAFNLALKNKWGGKLNVLLQGCTVKNIGNYGATCDHGAYVRIQGCTFDSCQMYGVFIKGETDVDISHAAFLNHQNAAIVQGVNYNGVVNIQNVVCFKNKADIMDEMVAVDQMQRKFAIMANMYSTLIVKKNIMSVNSRKEVPGVSDLMLSLQLTQDTLKPRPRPEKLVPPSSAASFVPCRGGFRSFQPSYYAIGNTAGHDVLKDKGWASDDSNGCTKVLFAACGDVRNVVETTTKWWRKYQDQAGILCITLNDQSASILARDLILLELFRTASPRCVAEAWACLGVKPQVKKSITEVMKSLNCVIGSTHGSGPAKSFPFFVHEEENTSMMQPVLTAWMDSTLELKDVNRDLDHMTLLKAEALSQQAARATSKSNPSTDRQIKSYLQMLSVGSKATALNITMLEAPALLSSGLYWSSSIYRATNSAEPFVFIEDRVYAMKSALNSGRVQIKVSCCDVLELPHAFVTENGEETAMEKPFDVADFTNVADYVGLGNVLGIGSLLAKRMIYVQQMRWERSTGDMKRYLAECLGLKCGNKVLGLNIFKHLSGLSLKEYRIIKDVLNMTWEVDGTKLDEEKILPKHKFLKIAANYCKVLPSPSSDGSGKIMPETLGLFRGGKWLRLFGEKMQTEYPLYSDCIQVSRQRKDLSVVCKIECPAIDYFKFTANASTFDNMVTSVLVVERNGFKKIAAVVKTLPEIDTNGTVIPKDEAGFHLDAASSFLRSIILHVQCDFDELALYVAVPSDFLEKSMKSKLSLLYVIEHPELGFVPLTPLLSPESATPTGLSYHN